MGGVVEACCLQPIGVVKTRRKVRGILQCGTMAARTEGVRALWKSLTPFANHLTLKYALRLGSNALFQSAFKDSKTGALSNPAPMTSGFGTGVLEALLVVTPFETRERSMPDNLTMHRDAKFHFSRASCITIPWKQPCSHSSMLCCHAMAIMGLYLGSF